jgi:hypothetical protein
MNCLVGAPGDGPVSGAIAPPRRQSSEPFVARRVSLEGRHSRVPQAEAGERMRQLSAAPLCGRLNPKEVPMGRTHDGTDPLADALIGAAAGAAAALIMDRLDWFMFLHEDPEARRRTQAVRPGGMDPGHVAADRIATARGYELEPKDNNPFGKAIHFSLGIGPGALYGVLRHRVPAVTAGRGLLFGLGLSLVQDEGLNALTGLSARPGAYPWQAHARGFVAHAVYGLVLDAALNLMDQLMEAN